MPETRAVLLGHPVHHSRSPELFAALGQAGGPVIDFGLLDVAPADLDRALAALRAGRWSCAGVTLPHKEAAAARCEALHPSAVAAGAVNAILRRLDGSLLGANTDGAGFVRALAASFPRLDLSKTTAVLLGAGGAARGVGAALRDRGARVELVSRDPSARTHLHADAVLAWSDADLVARVQAADLVVQATPLGMSPDISACVPLPAQALHPRQVVADLVYTPWETRFLRMARGRGCRAMNGWPMLVHQAAVAVDLWLGEGQGDGLPEAVRGVEGRDPLQGSRAAA